MDSFDFDHWRALASSDAETFIRARREALAALIALAAPERRAALQALQDDIEVLRAMNPNADHVINTLVAMMTERLDVLISLTRRFDRAAQSADAVQAERVRR